ncbi:hypothetical protein [Maricaulis sp. CAU 1757]
MKSTTGLLLAALTCSTALSGASLAQDDAVTGVLACQGIEDVSTRLACFDAAAVRLAAARSEGEIVIVSRQDVEAVERDSFGFSLPSLPRFRLPVLAGRAAHDALDSSTTAATTAPATQPSAPAATTAPSIFAAPTPSPAPIAEAAAESDVVILERNRDGDVDRVRMALERVRVVGYNTHVFHMENGQVWRQTDDGRVRVPRDLEGAFAEVRRGAMDSYLLRINGEGRAVRVRREQ